MTCTHRSADGRFLSSAFVLLTLCGAASAQTKEAPPVVIGMTNFIHATANLEKTTAFYRDIFGLDQPAPPRPPYPGVPDLIGVPGAQLDPGFGKEGILDMVVPYNGLPAIFKNVVMVGAGTGEKEDGPPGNTRAYDARIGAKVWEFQSIPGPVNPVTRHGSMKDERTVPAPTSGDGI